MEIKITKENDPFVTSDGVLCNFHVTVYLDGDNFLCSNAETLEDAFAQAQAFLSDLKLSEIDRSLLKLIRLGLCQVIHGGTKEYLNAGDYSDKELLAIFNLPGTAFVRPGIQ